jgi:hypothetical protein
MERVMSRVFPCAQCKKEFASRASLHKHIKQHGLNLASYYTQYHPRENKLTGEPLPFKRFDEYFERDFSTKQQMFKWCNQHPKEEVKRYALSILEKRQLKKKRKYGPFHLETANSFMPSISIYKELFGSYNGVCETIGCEPLYGQNLPTDFFDKPMPNDLVVAVDTREQKPLKFSCTTQALKLDIGDYTTLGEHYNYTFVDRKSGNDLQGTLNKHNVERFKKEIQRAEGMDAYLFVVIESSISKIIKENKIFNRRANMDYVLKQIKEISHEYPRTCQFIFVDTREIAAEIIPRLLVYGKKIWQTDMQYFLDQKNELD